MYKIELTNDQHELILTALHVYRREAANLSHLIDPDAYERLKLDLEKLLDLFAAPF